MKKQDLEFSDFGRSPRFLPGWWIAPALAVAVLLALAIPAFAVDFATPIKTIDGTEMRKEDKSILTINEVTQNALLASYPDEQNLSGEEKVRRWVLAMKIDRQRKNPDLTADEIALIKKLIAKAYNPLIVGQSWSLLDPASVPKEK